MGKSRLASDLPGNAEGSARSCPATLEEDDPLLPTGSVDAVLVLKTYHEIAQPVRVLTRLRTAMRTGARLGVIDRNGSGDDHGVKRDTVVAEAAQAGFALVDEYDFVKPDGMDYFLIFRAR